MKNKYYFEDEESEYCWDEKYFQDKMQERDITELEVIEGVIVTGTDYFFCSEFNKINNLKTMRKKKK